MTAEIISYNTYYRRKLNTVRRYGIETKNNRNKIRCRDKKNGIVYFLNKVIAALSTLNGTLNYTNFVYLVNKYTVA